METAKKGRGREVREVQGYADGVAYAVRVGARMSGGRRLENARYVMGTGYVRRGSVTRAYWLGFVRTMRKGA